MPLQERISLADKQEIVRQNAGITTIEPYQDAAMANLRSTGYLDPYPDVREIDLTNQASNNHLKRYCDPKIMTRVLDPKSTPIGNQAIRPLPPTYDQERTGRNYVSTRIEALLAEPNSELRREWIDTTIQGTQRDSKENLQAIDAAAEEGRILRTDVLIIGTSLTATILACAIAGKREITAMTDGDYPGQTWLERLTFYLNSSVAEATYNGNPLPVDEGATTPTRIRNQLHNVGAELALLADEKKGTSEEDVLTVTCNPGNGVRKYLPGSRFGEFLFANEVKNIDHFLTEQTADIFNIQEISDPTTNPGIRQRVTFTNRNGVSRQIEANLVLIATGPGPETSTFTDQLSIDAYNAAKAEIGLKLAQIGDIQNEIAMTNQALFFPQREKRIKKLERKLKNVRLSPPKILTRESIELLIQSWKTTYNSDPEKYPFTELMQKDKRGAFVGGKNSSFTNGEFFRHLGPKAAYPEGSVATPERSPEIAIYNFPEITKQFIEEEIRLRYLGLFLDPQTGEPRSNVSGINEKVTSCKIVTVNGEELVQLTIPDPASGNQNSIREVDFAVIDTGLKRPDLRGRLGLTPYADLDGNTVALSNATNTIVVAGPACGFEGSDFAQEIRNILAPIDIDNTVADWVYGGALTPHAAYTLLANGPFDKEWITSLAEQVEQTRETPLERTKRAVWSSVKNTLTPQKERVKL